MHQQLQKGAAHHKTNEECGLSTKCCTRNVARRTNQKQQGGHGENPRCGGGWFQLGMSVVCVCVCRCLCVYLSVCLFVSAEVITKPKKHKPNS